MSLFVLKNFYSDYTKNNTVSSNKDSEDYDELDCNITTENNEANVIIICRIFMHKI